MKIIDIASIRDTFICDVIVIEIDHYRVIFHFDEGFFVFVFMLKKGNFGDISTWKIVTGFE